MWIFSLVVLSLLGLNIGWASLARANSDGLVPAYKSSLVVIWGLAFAVLLYWVVR